MATIWPLPASAVISRQVVASASAMAFSVARSPTTLAKVVAELSMTSTVPLMVMLPSPISVGAANASPAADGAGRGGAHRRSHEQGHRGCQHGDQGQSVPSHVGIPPKNLAAPRTRRTNARLALHSRDRHRLAPPDFWGISRTLVRTITGTCPHLSSTRSLSERGAQSGQRHRRRGKTASMACRVADARKCRRNGYALRRACESSC